MAPNTVARYRRGLSVLELLVAMAASIVVVVLVVHALTALERDQAVRVKIADLQGTARQALDLVEFDLRHASLGTNSGVVWTASNSARASRPTIQIFTSLPGGADGVITDAKPLTDAILVVEAVPGQAGRTVTRGGLATSIGALEVVDATPLAVGDLVLIGDYGDACWGKIAERTASGTINRITLAEESVNVLPGRPVPQLGAGAAVRRARARLYYINTKDELVRLALAVPRAPTSAGEVVGRDVLGRGFENMQVDCELETGTGVATCSDAASNLAPVIASADPIGAEAASAFGAFTAGGGPRLTAVNVTLLRAVSIHAAVRSVTPIRDSTGDDPIPLSGARGTPVALGPGGQSGLSGSDVFPRRAYRITAGVRNTSMGTF